MAVSEYQAGYISYEPMHLILKKLERLSFRLSLAINKAVLQKAIWDGCRIWEPDWPYNEKIAVSNFKHAIELGYSRYLYAASQQAYSPEDQRLYEAATFQNNKMVPDVRLILYPLEERKILLTAHCGMDIVGGMLDEFMDKEFADYTWHDESAGGRDEYMPIQEWEQRYKDWFEVIGRKKDIFRAGYAYIMYEAEDMPIFDDLIKDYHADLLPPERKRKENIVEALMWKTILAQKHPDTITDAWAQGWIKMFRLGLETGKYEYLINNVNLQDLKI